MRPSRPPDPGGQVTNSIRGSRADVIEGFFAGHWDDAVAESEAAMALCHELAARQLDALDGQVLTIARGASMDQIGTTKTVR